LADKFGHQTCLANGWCDAVDSNALGGKLGGHLASHHVHGSLCGSVPHEAVGRLRDDTRSDVDDITVSLREEVRYDDIDRVENALNIDVKDACSCDVSSLEFSIVRE